MLPHELLEQEVASATTLEGITQALEKLLSSGLSVWQDGSVYYTRHQVGHINGLKIEVFAREHPPPHFHVSGGGVDAVFSLEDCALLNGRISGSEEKLVRWWYARSRAVLITTWNEVRPLGCPVGPIEE